MVSLFKKFPAVMGVLSLLLSMAVLYLAVEQLQVSKDLPGQPEKLTMAEIKQRMMSRPVDIWAEVLDGHVDCHSIENWKVTTNFFFETKYSTLLITNADGTAVLRVNVKDWPACETIRSQPMTGIISKDRASIETEVWVKNLNHIQQYPEAYVMYLCGACTPAKKLGDAWIGFGLSTVFFIFFAAGIAMEADRYRKRIAGES
jgi:hypothetical protein